jgi:hypothetical protein
MLALVGSIPIENNSDNVAEKIVESEGEDLLPERSQSRDVATLLSRFASNLDGNTALSALVETDRRRVGGRASSKYPRMKKIKGPNGKMVEVEVDGVEVLDEEPPRTAVPSTAHKLVDTPVQDAVAHSEPAVAAADPSVGKPVAAEKKEKETPVGQYEWECGSSRTNKADTYSVEEIVGLQSDVCHGESSAQWNDKHDLSVSQSQMKFIVDTANFQTTPQSRAAALGVRMYVLQPFEHCNRRTATCAAFNALHNAGVRFKPGVKFWDLKAQLDLLEGSAALGSWDETNHQIKLVSAHSEQAAIDTVSKWLDDHTLPAHK